ncbi:MAG TPA: hypothetical protein VNB64_10455 [Solirubrobacteraceae bacterium]|nr:hypothetical protein [Solirubrobacteraceae bacterium]
MPRLRPRALVTLVVLAAAAAAPAEGRAVNGSTGRSLTTGFTDPVFNTDAFGERAARMQEAAGLGASSVRVDLSWWQVADKRPAGDATDPANPAYSWSQTDAAVREAEAHGLDVLFNVFRAPPWAEGPDRPANVPAATWRPDATAFGEFALAAARRYSGTFADPAKRLPRVRFWGVWNEPNLGVMLTPQWVQSGGRPAPASPAIYRSLLNALYRSVKSVAASNLVVAGSTSPYGDDAGGDRMRPARFLRELFCLDSALRYRGCADRPRLDVLSHHPYNVAGPLRRARHADDVSTPDMGKVVRILRRAQRVGAVRPAGSKRVWVTEIGWESRPPDPDGVYERQHARWLEYAFYRLWRAGVDRILWFQVRDQRAFPSYASTFQTGVELADGKLKRAARAFRFLFVVDRVGRKAVRVWGKAPDAGSVRVQRRTRRGWRTLASVRPGANRVFYARLPLVGAHDMRAISRAGAVSIQWPATMNLMTVDPRS